MRPLNKDSKNGRMMLVIIKVKSFITKSYSKGPLESSELPSRVCRTSSILAPETSIGSIMPPSTITTSINLSPNNSVQVFDGTCFKHFELIIRNFFEFHNLEH